MKIIKIINIHNFLCKIGFHNWIPIRKKNNHKIKYWRHKDIIKHREVCCACHKKKTIQKTSNWIHKTPILDLEGLTDRGIDFVGGSKDWPNCKNGLYEEEDTFWGHIKGRRVRYWKLVYISDDREGDEYTPVFYHRKKRRIG